MIKHLQYFLFLSMLLLLMPTFAGTQTLSKLDKPFKAPDFTTQGEDGKTYRLSDYRGKYVVLNFWATWCPPCREEIPSMERMWEKVQNRNIQLLAVNMGEDIDKVFEFIGNYQMSFPALLDRNGEIIESYPVRGLPTTYVINPQGVVTHRAVGSREWDDDALIKIIFEDDSSAKRAL